MEVDLILRGTSNFSDIVAAAADQIKYFSQ